MEKRPTAPPEQQEKTMDRSTTNFTPRFATFFVLLTIFAGLPAIAQVPVDSNGSPVVALGSADDQYADASYDSDIAPLTAAELETLVGPIALYPDDLLAIVLPASTYPLQVVQAARFLEAYAKDDSLKPDESWDESVVALTNYPEVIQLLNGDIDWTWRLGEAVISQQESIIAAVESFRDRAYAAGNLKSDKYQTVSKNDDIIEIVPIEDDVIYVPYYEPERVVVYQPQPAYYYYARPYPVYYYPYSYGHPYSSDYFWGVTTAFRIGWATDRLRVLHPSYRGHPYYGSYYSGDHYRRSSISVYNTVYVNNARRHSTQRYRSGDYWRPRRSAGARQSDYYSHARTYRNDVRRVRNSSNRNNSATRRGSAYTRSDRNRRQGATTVANNDRRQRPTSTSRENRRQRATATTNTNRRQRATATVNDSRRQRPASVARSERRNDADRTRAQRARPVARNTNDNRRQSGQQTQRQVTRHNSSRSSQAPRQARSQPQRQARSQPQRQARSQPQRQARSQPQRQARSQPQRQVRSQPQRQARSQPQRQVRSQPQRQARSQPRRAQKSRSARASGQKSARATSRGRSGGSSGHKKRRTG
jgi:uncharacterized protein DUF3300